MEANSSRWTEVTPSSFAHERAALQYVRELLPDRHPFQAWSNFTFVSDQGHVREVDLLVAAPTGFYLIEIKNYRGRLTNDGSTWTLTGERRRTFDNPLPLADQKAKELKGLLARAASKDRGLRVPFLRGCVFLAEPGMVCELAPEQRHHLYAPDQGRAADVLRRIGADLLLGAITHAPPQQEFLRALPRLLKAVGIQRTRRSVAVGPWQIDPRPYESGPTWQDHHATREDIENAYRRIRIYLYERQSDREKRESVQHAAQREFLAGQGIDHPGLLVPRELLEHDMGPALVIDQRSDAVRLDHYLVEHTDLDLPTRLGMVRELAEAVRYAHDRRLVHRALSPRAIIVEQGGNGRTPPRLRIGEWQAAARGLSAAGTSHRVAPTTHAAQHVEAAAAAYLAPEFAAEADGTVAIDVFGLGATAYLILTGQAPAAGRPELMERLAAEGGLHPSAVSDAVPADLDTLIEFATAPRVSDRFADVEEFLDELDRLLAPTAPPDDPEQDPWDAQPGAELPDGSTVVRVLGTGATARAFLVQRDGLDSVLKVGRTAQSEERLGDEAVVLEGLRHEHLVLLKRGVFPLGTRHAIEIDFAGEQTLAQHLRTDGALVPDQLQRFGDQLLDVLDYLGRRDTYHRDVKPDNLGVRRHPKRGSALVLFDFSLAGAAQSDVQAGTRGYRDPFLGTARRPTYDTAAELYAAAVTLHEMASLEIPVWGMDGTDAQFVEEVTLSAELFDAAVRDPLTAFFRKALHRDADQRFPTAGAMRQAWGRIFTALDEARPATTSYTDTDDPQEQRDEAAAVATPDTALDAAGLSLRAVAVAQRLGANTVGELLNVPTRELWRARGLSKITRTELVSRTSQWRRAFAAPVPDNNEVVGSTGDGGVPPSLDQIASRLIPSPTKRGVDQADLTRRALGLPDAEGVLPVTRWPTLAQVADELGLTGARIAQIMGTRRKEWAADGWVADVREELDGLLVGLGRVAAAAELVEQLLASRGCVREEVPERRRAYGYAVLRAAVEADALAEAPRFATRRHDQRLIVALQVSDDESIDTPSDAQLLDMAVAVADEAVKLAARDPLPTPVTVVRTLADVAARFELIPMEQRLVQLAAATSARVWANARLEVYPRDLDPIRALRLSQAGAGVPEGGLSSAALAARVAARFPGLAPLPEGLELSRLLREAGFDLRWNGEVLVPPTLLTASSSQQSGTAAGAVALPAHGSGGAPESRISHVLDHGGVRFVTFRRSRWAACRGRVAHVAGVDPLDVSAAFVLALREVAAQRRIADFDVVLRADAPDADTRARANLQRVVDAAWERLEQQWADHEVLVLDQLTPLARYGGGTALLNRVLAAARSAGRSGGPRTVVLLCPAEDGRQAPRIGTHAIGLESGEEWIAAPSSWTSSNADVA